MLPRKWWRLAFTAWLIGVIWLLVGVLLFVGFSVQLATSEPVWLVQLFIRSGIMRVTNSVLLALFFATLAVLGFALLSSFFIASWILSESRPYGASLGQTMRLIFFKLIGLNPSTVVIEDGKIKESETKGDLPKLGGPGLVIIRPYNAVVFEQTGRITRIEGPGEVFLRLGERIKDVVDLRNQARGYEAVQVLTRDRVPLMITGGVGFRIQRLEDILETDAHLRRVSRHRWDPLSVLVAMGDSEEGIRDMGRVHRRSIYNAVYGPRSGRQWHEQVANDAEGEIRRAVRLFDFGQIYNQDAADTVVDVAVLEAITRQATDGLRRTAARYGVHVLGVGIRTIQIEQQDDIQEAYFAALGARWRNRVERAEVQVEGEAFRGRAQIQTEYMAAVNGVLGQFRDALAQMSGPGQPMPREIIERYLQLAERLLQNILTDHSTARRYLETMEVLASRSQQSVLAAGVNVTEMSDFLTAGIKPPPDEEHPSKGNLSAD
jgi:hypothetical protein